MRENDRVRTAKAEAADLGYTLFVEELADSEPFTHQAFAAPRIGSQATTGRAVASGTSAGAAAEAGVDMLRRIVKDGEAWPNP